MSWSANIEGTVTSEPEILKELLHRMAEGGWIDSDDINRLLDDGEVERDGYLIRPEEGETYGYPGLLTLEFSGLFRNLGRVLDLWCYQLFQEHKDRFHCDLWMTSNDGDHFAARYYVLGNQFMGKMLGKEVELEPIGIGDLKFLGEKERSKEQ